MGWIKEQFRRLAQLQDTETLSDSSGQEDSAESQSVWLQLQNGIRLDAEDFKRGGGDCNFEHPSDNQVRIVNPAAKMAAVITAALDSRTIEYSYQAEADHVAVPENGVFTIREHGPSEQLYSADQPVSLEQARQMIMQPVLFPDLPTDQAVA